ncbi:MAG: T9SS type A sorting domain-containing protein, partial [Bacteroidales bacterium]|nr:T9SS type A sorting domain-containing protein [Bacteroidales bacterium]
GSLVEGSLLIRPVLGKKIHDYPVPPVKRSNTLIIQPNPAKSAYFVKLLIPKDFCSLSDYDDLIVNIFNLYGQSILTSRFKENFYIPQLSKGMYIVRVINTNNNSSLVNKLIISQ